MPTDEIVLYRSVASRSFTPLWMLEELGVPYRLLDLDLRRGEHKSPQFLAVNPMGKVPALVVGGSVVTEVPAICLYLADRFGYGQLAPRIEDADRGKYLRWCVYATAAAEPALMLRNEALQTPPNSLAWGSYDDVVRTLAGLLDGRDYVLGDRFSAADVVLGAQIGFAIYNKWLPDQTPFSGYNARLGARAAYQKAAALTWPPELMAELQAKA